MTPFQTLVEAVGEDAAVSVSLWLSDIVEKHTLSADGRTISPSCGWLLDAISPHPASARSDGDVCDAECRDPQSECHCDPARNDGADDRYKVIPDAGDGQPAFTLNDGSGCGPVGSKAPADPHPITGST